MLKGEAIKRLAKLGWCDLKTYKRNGLWWAKARRRGLQKWLKVSGSLRKNAIAGLVGVIAAEAGGAEK